MVLWFYSCKVVCVLGFLVFWFLGFLVSKKQIPISCFLKAIDPTSHIFDILFNGYSFCVGVGLFQNCQNVGFPPFEIYGNKIPTMFPSFYFLLKYFGLFNTLAILLTDTLELLLMLFSANSNYFRRINGLIG